MKKLVIAVLLAAVVSACATNPNKIEATYVSPLKYAEYDCTQIALERASVERRTNELYHSLKKESNKDAAQMGVGLVLFWPALFFLEGGDGPQAAEYAQLKGEYNALEDVSIAKRCSLDFADELSDTVTEETETEQ